MTDAQRATLQRKLNRLTTLANEVVAEAQALYPEGSLFFESGGAFHVMDGDCDSGAGERQKHVVLTSRGFCTMGCGSW